MPSKNVHIVTHTGSFDTPNDPSTAVAGGVSDASMELSKKYGRNVRQGHNFRLIGYGVSVRVPGQDTGAAITASLTFVEPNRHLVKAWNNMFQTWRKQKQIQAKVGRQMRYDDFELALNSGSTVSRTSEILDDPFTVADGDAQKVGIAGNSDDGANYTSISDVYNSRFPAPAESETHYGASIKSPKFGSSYIDSTTNIYTSLQCGAVASGGVHPDPAMVLPDHLGWGISMQDIQWLPADNHVNVMCGLVDYQLRAFPEDTAVQLADNLEWQLTLVYEGWSPLAEKKGGKR